VTELLEMKPEVGRGPVEAIGASRRVWPLPPPPPWSRGPEASCPCPDSPGEGGVPILFRSEKKKTSALFCQQYILCIAFKLVFCV
jgi:hypothetical protein